MPKKYKHRKTFTYGTTRYEVRADTLEELGAKLERKKRELEDNKQKESNILVKEWAEQCFNTYKTNLRENSRKTTWDRINRCILKNIGDMRLKSVTPLNCQEVLNLQKGKSKSHINKVTHDLKFIFSHAVYNDLIPKDPTLLLQKPQGTYTPHRAITEYERNLFEKIALTDRKYYWALLMLYCGCRPNESYNCKLSDIFFIDETPMLHIRGTKSVNADRNVPVPLKFWEIIKNLPKDEYISMYNRKQIEPYAKQRLWKQIWRAMNIEAGTTVYRNQLMEPYEIPKSFQPYCLRHEFCSDLARRGIDIRIAQKLMGHSDISLTANLYTHVDNKDILKALGATQGSTLKTD